MNHSKLSIVPTSPPDDPLLTTDQVAGMFGATRAFLEQLRSVGGGPEFIKVARLVRYRRSAVERWLCERTVSNTTEARAIQRRRRPERARL